MSDSLNIQHMTLIKYVDGNEVFSENVINANNRPFKKGDITWFDVSPTADINSIVEFAISYTENLDGIDSDKTEPIPISNSSVWVDFECSKDSQLKLIDMK